MEEVRRDIDEKKPVRYGPWDMLRDVLSAAIDHGQFTTAIVGLVTIVFILRIPAQELASIPKEILDGFHEAPFLGYILSVAIGAGWRIHVKTMLMSHDEEIRRRDDDINNLKSKL